VKRLELLAVEHVEDGTFDTCHLLEVAHGGRVDIDATHTPKLRLKVSNPGMATVETHRATTQTTEKVKVADLHFLNRCHEILLAEVGTRIDALDLVARR
jgi:hypothetical protein